MTTHPERRAGQRYRSGSDTVTCMVAQDGQFARSSIHTVGTPYKGPERIARPRLAHQSQWADEAEDVR